MDDRENIQYLEVLEEVLIDEWTETKIVIDGIQN